jgi:NitT/TauT family transport system ATP-binding protein
MLQLRGIGKTHANGTVALSAVDATLLPGEFVSLLGPSGCGKSTLLRIVAGLSRASEGTLVWRPLPGDDTRKDTDTCRAARVSCVFQEPTLLPWATTWNNVFLPLRLQRQSRREARPQIDRTLSLVGLSDFADAYPRELSGGMKMRVAVARALVSHPECLLLDEPFAALDEITRNRLNDDLLAAWQDRGWTSLFVTHSVYESVYLSSRILVMSPRPGRIVEEIPVDLPRPRTEDLRLSSEFSACCQQVSAALRRATANS